MLQVKNVTYGIGDRQLLNSVTFSLANGEKGAIVGVNGAGKSTLIKIIMGEISPNEGDIIAPKKISYVPQVITQESAVQDGCSVEEFMLEGRGLNDLAAKMHKLVGQMGQDMEPAKMEKTVSQYSEAQEEFQSLGGYEAESEIEKILNGIGLRIGLDRKVSSLSGGEKSRLAFARSLFVDSDLLILDEPTNHIDRRYYGWLGAYLKQVKSSVLVVSHHKDFINPFTKRIIEVEKLTGRVREYRGSYDDYLIQSAENERTILNQVKWFDKEIARLKEASDRLKHGGPTKASQAMSMLKRVERLEGQRTTVLESAKRSDKKIRFTFATNGRGGSTVITVRNLTKSLGSRTVLSGISLAIGRGEHVVVLGKNGSGKTTFIRILMGIIEPDSGSMTLGHNITVGYYAQEHENLNPNLTVLEEAQRSQFDPKINARSVLGRFLFSNHKVEQKVGSLSEGEKSRLSICKLILQGHNLLVLDEPTNYLDQDSRDALCEAVQDYEGTIVFVSHDRTFIEKTKPTKAIVMPEGKMQMFSEKLLTEE